MNLFVDNFGHLNKLYRKYKKYGCLYVGVDFDDTIRDFTTGEEIPQVVEALKESIRLGHKICLYTVREGFKLVEAIDFCKKIGLKIDYINYSPLSPKSTKPMFNILLDDRAGLIQAVAVLNTVNHKLKEEQNDSKS